MRLTICTQTLSADTRKSFLNIGASIAKRPADLLDYFPVFGLRSFRFSALFLSSFVNMPTVLGRLLSAGRGRCSRIRITYSRASVYC